MLHKSKIKLAAILGITIAFSSLSLLFHFKYSVGGASKYKLVVDEFYQRGTQKIHSRRLWGPVRSLLDIQGYAAPRDIYPAPREQNGFIYAKIYGGFENIQSAICDLVVVSRLLNATLVIPEIQATTRAKGISSKFRSFSYIYDEDHFIKALSGDVVVIKSLPSSLKEARKKIKFPTFSPKRYTSADFYFSKVLPRLKSTKAVGIIITNGGCLESTLPPSMVEFQRLRCRVAFHALQLRQALRALGNQIVERLRSSGRPYLAYHPGLLREKLAFHGCAELFQDVHTELIQYRRKQMIKEGTVKEELNVDSVEIKKNGSCPLMPEEVGLLLQALGYPANTLIYLSGSETFGGQRVLIPFRAMYINLVDRTSVCTRKELAELFGPENPIPLNIPHPPPVKSAAELLNEWNQAGPRPRPLPPPPARPFYPHEKEGWYGWVREADDEPDPSLYDLRMHAHRILLDALDYHVSVEADAFFPGFNNDGGGWPDYSSLIMGHRLYQAASRITYRPDRKTLAELFLNVTDNLYHPPRNWTLSVREHLNKSLGVEGMIADGQRSKSMSFLSHPLPECSCWINNWPAFSGADVKSSHSLVGGEECPNLLVSGLPMVALKATDPEDDVDFVDLPEEESDMDSQQDSERVDASKTSDQDDEMDPDD